MRESELQNKRIAWIDYAKGIGIFSVVALHVFTGIINAGITDSELAQFIEKSWRYYSFNMPLFFFIGGFFISRSVHKPLRQFLSDRVRTLVYPYFLWSLMSLFFGTLVIQYTNSGISLTTENLLRLLYNPIQHYWFLYVIFLVVVSWMILAKFGFSPYIFLVISTVLLLLINFTDIKNVEMLRWIRDFMRLSVFFAVGAIISQPFRDWIVTTPTYALVILSLIFLGIWGYFVSQGIDFALSDFQPFITAIGMLGALFISKLLADFKALPFVEIWGRMSLEIYLAHVMAGAAFRIVLQHVLYIDNFVLNLVGGITVAILAPITLAIIAKRLGVHALFKLPKRDIGQAD